MQTIAMILLSLEGKLNAFYRNIAMLKRVLLLIAVSFAMLRILYFVIVGGQDKRTIFTEILALIGVILLIYLSEDIVDFIARLAR